jgi:hypothetical protein
VKDKMRKVLTELQQRGAVRRRGRYWRFVKGANASVPYRVAEELLSQGYIEEIEPTAEKWGKAHSYYSPEQYHFYVISEAGRAVLEEQPK